MRPKIHSWMIATVALALPLQAHAQDAPKWCSVAPADGAPYLPSLEHELQGKLDSQPQPLAHVHTEGTLPHKGIRDESIMAERDWPVMRDAAYAWRAGAGDAYLGLATRYFMGWVNVYKPDLNPIDETNLDALVDTYAVIAPTLKPDDRAVAQAYIRGWAKAYIDAIDSHKIVSPSPQATTWNNNWQSHRIKLVTMMAVALNDDELFHAARRLFQAQIEANMHGDGEVIDFEERDACITSSTTWSLWPKRLWRRGCMARTGSTTRRPTAPLWPRALPGFTPMPTATRRMKSSCIPRYCSTPSAPPLARRAIPAVRRDDGRQCHVAGRGVRSEVPARGAETPSQAPGLAGHVRGVKQVLSPFANRRRRSANLRPRSGRQGRPPPEPMRGARAAL